MSAAEPTGALVPSVPPGRLALLASESRLERTIYLLLALIVIGGFFFTTHQYWVPACPGTDQNGYLVGGKNFIHTFSTGFKPESPYEFVGHEWIEARGKYFPKYPLGLSVLFGLMLKIGGTQFGTSAAFMVNPIAMTLAMAGVFLLGRLLVGSFFALLATLLVATSPVCIGLTNTPNSHATAICCVTWGFYFLFRWWQAGGVARAIGAGLLIGSAVTLRYTEGMLLLPIVLVIVLNLRQASRQIWRQSALLLGGWVLPVVILAAYNWFSMHHLTGYDTTNESTGFTWSKFQDNWEVMLRELYNTGLFFTLPFALLGGFLLFRWNWRVGLVLASWALPNLLLYTAYYWAPDGPNISYLRFVLTIFPALAIATVFAFKWIGEQAGRRLFTAACGVLLAVGCAVNLNTALASSEVEMMTDRNLLGDAQVIMKNIPAGSLIFSAESELNYLQLVADYHLSDLSQFDARVISGYANVDPTAATAGLQPQRAAELYDRVKGLSDADMTKELLRQQNAFMSDQLTAGRRVFIVMTTTRRGDINRLLSRHLFASRLVTTWDDPEDFKAEAKPRWLGITRKKVPPEPKHTVTWEILEVTAAPPLPPPKPKPLKTRTAATRPVKNK